MFSCTTSCHLYVAEILHHTYKMPGIRKEPVEKYYYLADAEEMTAPIVKCLHQSKKPLTSFQLWEELWDSGHYESHKDLRTALDQLVEVKYVVKIPAQIDDFHARVHVYALTHEAHLEDID